MLTRSTVLLVRRELLASLHARWFIGYAAVVLVGGALLVSLGMGGTVIRGQYGFARAFAGLVHLALVFVPLMALVPAASSVAEERESGSLEYILSQPVTWTEVFLGKWAGLSVALVLSLCIGMGITAGIAVLKGVPAPLVVALLVLVVLLALTFIGLGLCLSVMLRSRARALTVGFLVWFLLVSLGSLGVMFSFIRWGLPAGVLTVWTFVNPIEAFRMGVISLLDPDLSLLGPIGVRLAERVGAWGTAALAAASLVGWTAITACGGLLVFRRAA